MRSIIITIPNNDPAITSNFEFAKKLADLRSLYPSWQIQGVIHGEERASFVPQKPRRFPALGIAEMQDETAAATMKGDAIDIDLAGDVRSDVSSSTASSTGNVVGQLPRKLRRGVFVQRLVPPYDGKLACITDVKDENRFRVEIVEGGAKWWCTRDEVVVATGPSVEEHAVRPSTIEENAELRRQIDQLRRALDDSQKQLKAALKGPPVSSTE